jgi:pilus assembly protein CpaB
LGEEMRIKKYLFLIVLIIFSLCGAYISYSYLISQNKPSIINTKSIVIAKKSIPFGTEISQNNIQVLDWPADSVLPAYIQDLQSVIGKKTTRSIEAGLPITNAHFTDQSISTRMAERLAPGKRAMFLDIDAHNLDNGDQIDLLVTRKLKKNKNGISKEKHETETLLQDVRVLEIGETGKNMTIEVSNKDAERLTLAMKIGKISTILRPPNAPILKLGMTREKDLRPKKHKSVKIVRGANWEES